MPASADQTTGHGKTIVLFVEENGGDWHARRLTAALQARGASVVVTTLKACAFDTRMESGLDIPGFNGSLPDGAFVRSISSGNLEQITLRLGILHALRASGVRVWNDARTIERCVDKSTATFLFQKAGLPVPETRVVEGREAALTHARQQQRTLVVKPLFGSQGNGVMRADTADDVPPSNDVGDVFYMQRYLRPSDAETFDDIRVFVSAGRVIASMIRQGAHWVTNVHQGGRPAPHKLDQITHDLALAACQAIGVDYAGVDLIYDPEQDRLLVLEINSNPAWKGLQSITHVDVAEILATDFLASLSGAQSPQVPTR
jgi:tetrahydromethanopterin:alpha-L-glutamate ligase